MVQFAEHTGYVGQAFHRRTAKSNAKGSGPCFRPRISREFDSFAPKNGPDPGLCSSPEAFQPDKSAQGVRLESLSYLTLGNDSYGISRLLLGILRRAVRGDSIVKALAAVVAALATFVFLETARGEGSPPANLALVATATTSFVSGHETIHALNNGFDPRNSNDKRHGAYGNWPRKGTQWVQYTWSQPIHTGKIDVYWFDDHNGVRLPSGCRLKYFDGKQFVSVVNANGPGSKKTNSTRRPSTTSIQQSSVWRSIPAANRPESFSGGFTIAAIRRDSRPWSSRGSTGLSCCRARPGSVAAFAAFQTSAGFLSARQRIHRRNYGTRFLVRATSPLITLNRQIQQPPSRRQVQYVLKLAAFDGPLCGEDTVRVHVVSPPPDKPLQPVATTTYRVTNPLLFARLKQTIIHWIPHCYEKLSDPDLPEGGIENFTQAGNKLAGRPYVGHRGPPWPNAYVHNTVESMCLALMFDPHDDREIIAAQAAIRKKLDDWIPKILSAQEPDGYLQTFYTLERTKSVDQQRRSRGLHGRLFH